MLGVHLGRTSAHLLHMRVLQSSARGTHSKVVRNRSTSLRHARSRRHERKLVRHAVFDFSKELGALSMASLVNANPLASEHLH